MTRLRDRFSASFYRGATHTFEPAFRFLYRIMGAGEDRALRAERLGQGTVSPVDSWWHAASLGEVAALSPVLALARDRSLTGRFIVTTTSAAGREAARKEWPDARLAPFDLPRTLTRVFDARQPRALILLETELWPNLLRLGLERGTRIGVVNGRISDRGWARWQRGAPVPREVLSAIRAVAARTEIDAERFIAIGAKQDAVRVTGNTKHDRADVPRVAHLPWKNGRLWTAGSVRPGEEGPVLDAFVSLRAEHPDLRLVLAPRHAEGEALCAAALETRGLRAARRSEPGAGDAEAAVLLVDTRGELEGLYAASAVAFVGGTLVPRGGHNVMEPARAGVPVLVGPHHQNVASEVRELTRAGGARVVKDGAELARALLRWLDSEAERSAAAEGASLVAARSKGAASRALDWLVARGVLPAV